MFKKFVVIAVLAVFITGCCSVSVVAPPGSDVKLMTPTQPAVYKRKMKNWYAVWGLVPIWNAQNGVSNAIRDNGLKEVRIETKVTFTDILISYFLGFVTIQTNTTVIEGNGN